MEARHGHGHASFVAPAEASPSFGIRKATEHYMRSAFPVIAENKAALVVAERDAPARNDAVYVLIKQARDNTRRATCLGAFRRLYDAKAAATHCALEELDEPACVKGWVAKRDAYMPSLRYATEQRDAWFTTTDSCGVSVYAIQHTVVNERRPDSDLATVRLVLHEHLRAVAESDEQVRALLHRMERDPKRVAEDPRLWTASRPLFYA